MISRREWLTGGSALLAARLCAPLLSRPAMAGVAQPAAASIATAVPDFSPRRITARMVSLRPYRREGFRVELETIADRSIVHNIGHGGAGITLSWGTARLAVDRLLALGQPGPVAVLGCGAVGLATAWLLHEAGRPVTIYASEVHPRVTSSVAGASFFPSLVVAGASRTPAFEAQLAAAVRTSHRRFLGLLGRGMGVFRRPHVVLAAEPPSPGWVSRLLPELFPPPLEIRDPSLPFVAPWVGTEERLFIETHRYLPALMGAVRRAGMTIRRRTFAAPEELGSLPERLIVNCTGLGSAGLFGHGDLIPVQGQLTRLRADPRLDYTLSAPGLYLHPRRDGLLLGGTQEFGVLRPRFDDAAEERILAGMRQLYRSAQASGLVWKKKPAARIT
jgi:glycine/D-amino acid oxidase-like deaminating enzyme